MTTNIDPLRLRKVMGRHDWLTPRPVRPRRLDHAAPHPRRHCAVRFGMVGAGHHDGEFVHASFATTHRMPTYDELVQLHRAVFNGYAYQVFAPPSRHVNIHPFALHLWGRLDGKPCLPEFGSEGTI